MNIQELAKKIAINQRCVKAYKYDLFYRDFDDMVELIGLVDDPNHNMKDFQGREMLFPKRWVTLNILDSNMKVPV